MINYTPLFLSRNIFAFSFSTSRAPRYDQQYELENLINVIKSSFSFENDYMTL